MPRPAAQSFSLHPMIDADRLRRDFGERGRVQISPFVEPETAAALRDHLLGRTDWRLAMKTAAKQPVQFERDSWNALSAAQREAVCALAAPSEPDKFRYMFEQIVAVGDDLERREPATILGRFAEFMNSRPLVDLVRSITGADDVTCADARATCYAPGHFLTMHDDKQDETRRRAAYVFGLTEQWRPEWGGLLLFHGEGGDVSRGYVPRMNVLTLFTVPLDHSVSLVSPFAPAPRYAVSGWLRAAP